jgi:WD40 repeat protein
LPNDDGEHSAVVFDLESGEIDLVLPLVIPDSYGLHTLERCSVQQINWSPDGTKLVLAVNNNLMEDPQSRCYYLQIYDGANGQLLLDLNSQGEFAVDWSPDGIRLLTGGENGRVQIWDTQNGKILIEMEGHKKSGWGIFQEQSDRVFAARFSPDGTQAATFSINGVVHIWDANTSELLHTLVHPQAFLQDNFEYGGKHKIGLAWSPAGDQIATAWYDGLGRVWNLATGETSLLLAGHTSNVNGIDWSPNGVYILTQGLDTEARLWVASTGQMIAHLPTHGFGNAAWSHDGHWMAVPTQTGLLVWDTSVLPPVLNPSNPLEGPASEGLWTPDGKLFIVSGYDGLVFDWAGDKNSWNVAHNDGFFAISPDSTRMVAARAPELDICQVIDFYSGEVLSELESPPPKPQGVYYTSSWSNDGTMVASGTYPGFWTVIWDPETGEELARSETVDGFMMRAQFSPDDKILAAPSLFTEGNSPVYLIDTQTGKTLRELPSEDGWSTVAMWSPDGKTLAVGYQSGVIKLWNTQAWTVKSTFTGHQGGIWDLNWSPNGQRIVSGDLDNNVVHIWEVSTGEIVATWDMQGLVQGFNDTDWSPDGRYISIHGTGDIPFLRRAWQSTEALIDYAYECCVWRELTPGEREQFGLPVKP